MKLRLPNGLRKALLACLAAVASLAPLSVTFASGTLFTAALTWSLASSSLATASQVTWTYGDETTEDVECSGTEYVVESDGSGGLTDFKLQGLGAGQTSFEKFWTNTDADQHNTLHIKQESQLQSNGSILCDWGNFFNLGGLIIDELTDADGQARNLVIGRTSGEGQHIRFQAENDADAVNVRIGTSTTIYGSSVKLANDGDWVIGAGKTLTFTYLAAGASHPDNMDPQFLIAQGKTLTLTAKGGIGSLTTNLKVVSEGTIDIKDSIHATFQNGMSLAGTLTLEHGSRLDLSGEVTGAGTLTIDEGGLLVLGSGATVGADLKIDLQCSDTNFDDPFWFFEGGIQGLDDATLGRVTINGSAVTSGKKLAVSGDGMMLVDSSQQGGTAEFTGPTITGDWTDGSKALGASGNIKLSVDGSGNGTQYSGGGESVNVKILCNNCSAAPILNGSITCDNLWLTKESNASYKGNAEFQLDINLTLNAKNIYVNDVGMTVAGEGNSRDLGTANLILGSNDKEWSGAYFSNSTPFLRKFTLSLRGGASLTTTGYMELQQTAQVSFDDGTLTVGSLQGNGDIILSGTNAGTDTLAITGSSESFHGHIRFEKSNKADITVQLADGITLTTAGITATTANGGNSAGGHFTGAFAESGNATVKVTGHNPVAAAGIVFEEGVTLELAEGSAQNFGAGSHITTLTGSGALGVQGGDGTSATLVVDSLTGYTGDVHLFGDGTEGQAVLQLGGGATLKNVVLRKGGGDLQLGAGTCTLEKLSVAAAPSPEGGGASQLHIGAAGAAAAAAAAASGTTLQFGAAGGGLTLGEHVELTLGEGIDYSGTIVVDASNGATGERLFEVESADLLDGLTLQVKLAADAFAQGKNWDGLQLFASGLDQAMKDALLRIIQAEGGTLTDGVEWGITDDGLLCFMRQAATLTWKTATDGVWQDHGDTMWTVEGGEDFFQGGDSVIFGQVDGRTTLTVQVEGTVGPANVKFEGASYTFNAKDGGADDSITVGGNLTLAGTGASATFNVPVTFSGDAPSITGPGTVTFNGNTSWTHSLTIGQSGQTQDIDATFGGDGSTVAGAGLVVEGGVTVEVSATGNKNFGGIEVKEGGRFVVGNSASWTTGNGENFVHGAGTLELNTGTGLTHAVIISLLDGVQGTATLEHLELASGTGLTVGSSGNAIPLRLGHVKNIWVKNGAGLSMNAPSMTASGVTLHLAGDGATSLAGDGAAGTDDGKLASEAAFAVWNHGFNGSPSSHNPACEWNIVLEEDAKIAVGGVSNTGNGTASEVLTVNGSFDAKTHELTKVGIATLKLTKMVADTEATNLQHAGAITVNGGTVEISGLAGDSVTSGIVATTVDLTAAEGSGNEVHFRVSGEGNTYTVQKVVMGDGTETPDGTGLATYAYLEATGGSTLVVTGAQTDLGGAGQKNVALDLREGAGAIQGGGTVELNSKVVGGNGLRVGGTGTVLLVKEAWAEGEFTGGLYLTSSGTVKLDADIEIGFLGGTEEGYGGTFNVNATDEHTVKIVEGGGSATNLTFEQGVKLVLAMESGGQTLLGSTLKGNIDLGAGTQLIFDGATGSNAVTQGSGKRLTGSGSIVVQNSGDTEQAALNWMGNPTDFTGTLVFDGTQTGSNLLALGSDLTVGNIEMGKAGTVNLLSPTQSAKLVLNYTGDAKSTIGGEEGQRLTLGTGITLEKKGSGEVELHYVTGGKVLVREGKLIANAQGSGAWAVQNTEVGSGAILSAATNDSITGTVQLNGGTIDMSGLTGNGSVINFEKVEVIGDSSKIGLEAGRASGTIHIKELTGGNSLSISEADGNTKHVEVDTLKDYTGAITGTLDFGKNGVIDMAQGKTGGSLEKAVVGIGKSLKKTGAGSFRIGTLQLDGSLHIVGEGELEVDTFVFGGDATFVYDPVNGKVPTAGDLLEFDIGEITGALTDGNSLTIEVNSQDESILNSELCLGITGNNEDVAELKQYFHLSTGDDFTLKWGTEDGQDTEHLYITCEWITDSTTEYDLNWGVVRANENHRGPGESKMTGYAAAYTGGPLNQLLEKDATATDFTSAVLSLAGRGTTEGVTVDGDTFYENNGKITGIRLTKGAGDAKETHLSIVGGSVYGADDTPASESRKSFIVLRPEAAGNNHYHLLVGGSSCVSSTPGGTGDAFLGFQGNTHIQVEGGVVDYIVGGNHVTNTYFGFKGDTFISVFDNNGSRPGSNALGAVSSEVRGGIVGGSVITSSDNDSGHHDFDGHTHIFLYTLLGNTGNTPHISDGIGEGGTPFTAVVGGNAWIDVPEASVKNELGPVFFGTSNIYVNLLGATPDVENDIEGDGENATGGFDKAIVGGNYAVAKPGVTGVARSSHFETDTTEEGAFATQIVIYANGSHRFTAGINGASRRDSGGAGTTEFIGNTLVEIHGGQYTEAVAGGMWFNATGEQGSGALAVHTGKLTGDTTVRIEDGSFWRVVGGNVSLEGGEGSSETFTGVSSVTITGGNFGARKQGVLDQTEIPAVIGGSFYRNTSGTATHESGANKLAMVTITGGTFNDVHIVGGDYANMSGVQSGFITLEGGTHVVIGGAGGAEGPAITGLVAAGSYLTDAGANGSISVGKADWVQNGTYATTLKIHGGSITAESGNDGTHAHGQVAVVAGNVLIDEGTTGGGHKSEIQGGTYLVVDGGTINGYVVGGSYSNDSQGGTNELTITGDSTLEFKGGTVNGNVVGGHFSENTKAPDKLTLGNVNITVAGGTINGYIFGGSFRRTLEPVTENGEQVPPQQGELTVQLLGGAVAGGVYAAGSNYNTGQGAELHVHTKKTTVQVTGDVQLSKGADERSTYVVLSGGYLRNSTGDGNNDYSTVGYSEGADSGTWDTTAAVLEFLGTGKDTSFKNLTGLGDTLRLQDFDAVNVADGLNVDMNGSQMLVMHKVVSAGDRGGNDSFTKLGGGDLTLASLKSWNAQKGHGTVEAYAGSITIDGGHLKLASGDAQSLLGGLAFNMANLKATGRTGEAYLQGKDGTLNFTGASADNKVQLKFLEVPDTGLAAGVYRLASGVNWEGIDRDKLTDYFDSNLTFSKPDEKFEGLRTFFALESTDDTLLLRVYMYSRDTWVWQGDESGEWGSNGENFSVDDADKLTEEKVKENDVYFYDGAVRDELTVTAVVTPNNVYVESGKFTLTPGAETGRLKVGTALHVGAKNDSGTRGEVEADFVLALGGNEIPEAVLHAGGRLTLSHASAIQISDSGGTELRFNGGTLKYGEVDGQLALSSDLSGQVVIQEDKADAIRIQVGDSAEEQTNAPAAAAETGVPFSVTWAGGASNNGIVQAAGYGLIKTGRGGFVLQTSGVTEFAGTLEAQEGTLELKVGGAVTIPGSDIQPTAADSTVQPRIFAEKDATLILAASGEGSGVTVNRAFSGTGTVVIGENVGGDSAVYTLAAANSDFAGTVRLAGNGTDSTVQVNTAGALGGGNTTLALAGRAIVAAEGATEITVKEIKVEDGTVNLVGGYGKDTEKSYTLTTGTVTGGGVLANAQGDFHVTLSASDLSGFTGVLVAGKQGVGSEGESTWTLTGTLANPEVATSLAGTGTVEIAFESTTKATKPVVLTGIIGDGTLGNTVNVENAMAGTALVLGGGVSGEKADTKAKNTSGGNLIFNDNEIWLGDEGHAGSWVGGVSGTGRFVLRDGVLGRALTKAEDLGGVTLSVDTAVKAGDGMAWVNAGGTAGSLFKDVTVNARGRLRNVAGDITVGKSNTKLTLYFDKTGIGTMKGHEDEYLIGGSGNLVVSEVTPVADEGAPFVLDFSNDGLLDILKTHRKDEVKSYLHLITGGGIQFGKTPEDQQQALDRLLRTGNYTTLLSALGFTLGVDGGDLTLLGSSKDVYLVLGDDPENQGDPHTVTDPKSFDGKKAVLVDENTTLTIDDPDNGTAGTKAFTLKNLVGLEGSTLAVGDETGKDDITVTFDNSTLLPADEEQANDPWLGELTDSEVYGRLQGLDTEFDGTIVGNGEKVNFEKEGAGTLTVGSESGTGGMDIDGTLTLKEGDVVLRGDATEDGSHLGGLTFNYAKKKGDGLTVQGARLTVDDITVEEGSDAASNNVDITDSGELVYGGKNGGVMENLHLKSSDESGTLSTDGTLTLGSGSDITGLDVRLDAQQSGDEQQGTGGRLELQGNAEMHARAVELGDKGQLELSGSTGKHTVEALSGTAGSILSGDTGTDLTVTGTGGNFSGTLSGGGKLTVTKDAEFTLKNVTTDAPDTANAWGIDVQSGGTFTLDTSEQHGGAGPRFGDVVFGSGSDVTLKFDYNADGGTTAHMNSLTFGDGSALTLESTSESPYTGDPDRIVIGYAANGEDVTADVDITLKGVSFLHFEAEGIHYDSGAYYVGTKQVRKNLFAEALPHKEKNAMAGAELFWSASSPESPALKEALKNPLASDLLRMLAGLTAMKDSGDASGLARALAAGAGASISVLGPALAEDIHRQLMSIRSRATGVMDDMQTDGYDAYPFWHAWITGEGGYRKLDADGFAPGYTLNNWGGSVGADATLSQRTSVGLAITAMYGDLKPEASDSATGDLDTVYLSGYLRHASGAWSHTFALSMGVSDIKLDRTVTYGMGSYRTHGNTDGLSFGAIYEIGYSRFVNKSGSFVLQPIANVELRHAMINGYTETGSDAGLQVDDIEQTVLTFGAGIRVQGLIGQQTFNHDALVEARALVKADVGDRSGTSRHAIIRDTTHAEVESAEVGAMGVETGVGLSIPLGLNAGSIILDGSVEFRSGWTSANASVGYRISF